MTRMSPMNDQQWTQALRRELGKLDPRTPRYQRLEQALKKLIGGTRVRPAVRRESVRWPG